MHLPAAWSNPRNASAQQRLWTRWWWLGSALTENDITAELTALHTAGFGGVEISPIYAPDDPAAQPIDYLSATFEQRFRHAVRTARAKGMDVDCILGTGWPYGGPWIGPNERAMGLSVVPFAQRKRPEGSLELGFSGELVALAVPTRQQVKRSGPGGAGNVVDPYSRQATETFLAPINAFFNRLGADTPRAVFNDSWEVYGATTTPSIAKSFEKSAGYPFTDAIASLAQKPASAFAKDQRCDYAAHIEALTHSEFLSHWNMFAKSHRAKTRFQAHGAPGNLIDFYAAADIPEAEQFGCGPLVLSGRQPLVAIPKPVSHEVAVEEMFICTLAASAAQLTGKPLVSAEAFTWLGEHGATPLDHIRAEVDELFLAGINHVFCHGTAASPQNAAWPGWMFYASNHFGPTNPWFAHIKPLTDYIARAQSLLQGSTIWGDALVYFPIWDARGDINQASPVTTYTLHGTADWLRTGMPGLAALVQQWFRDGSQVSMVSDALLKKIEVQRDGRVGCFGSSWKCIVIPECTTMPETTLARLQWLASEGAHVIVLGSSPKTVPGHHRREQRQQTFDAIWTALTQQPNKVTKQAETTFKVGLGLVSFAPTWTAARKAAGWLREPLADSTLGIRRFRIGNVRANYILNRANGSSRNHITVAHTGPRPHTATVLDPMTGKSFVAPVVSHTSESVTLRAALPKDSVRIIVWDDPNMPAPVGIVKHRKMRTLSIASWDVTPVMGSVKPEPMKNVRLDDWCTWSPAWRAFSGRAIYKANVMCTSKRSVSIDLGDVRHSARIYWNGSEIATLISAPYCFEIPAAAVRNTNTLEIEVANLMLNGLIGCEKSGNKWQKFYFVGIDYKPFTATSHGELPSGIIGPIVIQQEI